MKGPFIGVTSLAELRASTPAPVGKSNGGFACKAANSIASRRAAVDVLLIAQLVVVIGGVIALSCKKRLQTILATSVHRQKLFTIFPREIVEQLQQRRSWDDHCWIWNVPCAGHRGRADARRGFIFGVAIEHKEIEILFGHLA